MPALRNCPLGVVSKPLAGGCVLSPTGLLQGRLAPGAWASAAGARWLAPGAPKHRPPYRGGGVRWQSSAIEMGPGPRQLPSLPCNVRACARLLFFTYACAHSYTGTATSVISACCPQFNGFSSTFHFMLMLLMRIQPLNVASSSSSAEASSHAGHIQSSSTAPASSSTS